jgi:hypothetical protein
MQSASSGSPASAGAAIATISTPNPESEARLRALLAERGPTLRIRLAAPDDFDVSGHQLSATSLTLDVIDEDDVEGHTISLHFPRLEDAKQFEQRLIATGAIVGTLVVGGSGLALSQAIPVAPATPPTQQVQPAPQAADDVTYLGAISGSTGGALTGKEEALLTEMGGVPTTGTTSAFPGAISPSTGGALTGKEEGLLTVIVGDVAETSGVEVGTSSSTGDALSGKQEGILSEIAGDE